VIKFNTKILKQPDKSAWSYIIVSRRQVDKLDPPRRTAFRVKGFLDKFPIEFRSLLPVGDGRFILPINAFMRKGTGKKAGDRIAVTLELDISQMKPSAEFIACLKDAPEAYANYKKMNGSQKNFYNGWIYSAKTEETKSKRIAAAIKGLAEGKVFGLMLKDNRRF
jgi:hypothetical protein